MASHVTRELCLVAQLFVHHNGPVRRLHHHTLVLGMWNSRWHNHRSLLFWREIIYNAPHFSIIYSMDAFIEIDLLRFSRSVTSRNPLDSNAASVAARSRAREETAINRQAGRQHLVRRCSYQKAKEGQRLSLGI